MSKALERRGAANLAAQAAPIGKQRVYVRICYTSMGGDLLAIDAGPMSRVAAEAMVREHKLSTSAAIDAFIREPWMDGGNHGAKRVVQFPSQHPAPVVKLDDRATIADRISSEIAALRAGLLSMLATMEAA